MEARELSQQIKLKDRTDKKLLMKSGDVEVEYLRLEANRLLELKSKDRDSILLHVTVTFPGRRFASLAWSLADARRAMRLLERTSDDLFDRFRAFYIKTLVKAVDDYRRRDDFQPRVIAFIDDRQEGDLERYPHIHSVWFVPSGVVEPVRAWLESTDAAKAWADISDGGALDVGDVDPEASSVERVVAYDGKLLTGAAGADIATQALCRTYPDRTPREASKAFQRPRRPHEMAKVDRPLHRPRRRRRGPRRAPTHFAVVRLRSRRAG